MGGLFLWNKENLIAEIDFQFDSALDQLRTPSWPTTGTSWKMFRPVHQRRAAFDKRTRDRKGGRPCPKRRQKSNCWRCCIIFEQQTDEEHLLNVPQLVELLAGRASSASERGVYSDIDRA